MVTWIKLMKDCDQSRAQEFMLPLVHHSRRTLFLNNSTLRRVGMENIRNFFINREHIFNIKHDCQNILQKENDLKL